MDFIAVSEADDGVGRGVRENGIARIWKSSTSCAGSSIPRTAFSTLETEREPTSQLLTVTCHRFGMPVALPDPIQVRAPHPFMCIYCSPNDQLFAIMV